MGERKELHDDRCILTIRNRINNYHFDMDRMTSFEGDTGPYLQYAHARLCSITRKAALSDDELLSADFSLLTEEHAVDLIRQLASWPDVFLNTVKTQEPTTVLVYLFKMAHALSSSYDHLQVVGSEEALKRARMALYAAARQVLWNGMRLLGLSPVERYGSIVSPFFPLSLPSYCNPLTSCPTVLCSCSVQTYY